MSEPTRLTAPRYRVERRVPNEAAFVVSIADDSALFHSMLARAAAQLFRAGTADEVVAIDQDTEGIVARRDMWTVPRRGRPARGADRLPGSWSTWTVTMVVS